VFDFAYVEQEACGLFDHVLPHVGGCVPDSFVLGCCLLVLVVGAQLGSGDYGWHMAFCDAFDFRCSNPVQPFVARIRALWASVHYLGLL
jgi:hypothetical protein